MDLAQNATQVLFVFGTLTRLWAKKVKIEVDFDHEMLQDMERKYGPLIHTIFRPKTKAKTKTTH